MDRKLMDAGLAARRSVLTQIAVYCGIPVGVDCFRSARQVLADVKAKKA